MFAAAFFTSNDVHGGYLKPTLSPTQSYFFAFFKNARRSHAVPRCNKLQRIGIFPPLNSLLSLKKPATRQCTNLSLHSRFFVILNWETLAKVQKM